MRGRLNPKPVAERGLRAWPAMAMAMVLMGLAGVGISQTGAQPAPLPGLKGQDGAILAHLNAVIQFFRMVNEPVQKAGEPNDVVYREQAVAQASQIAQLAFESAKAEAALIAGGDGASAGGDEQQRIEAAIAANQQRIQDLEEQEKTLDREIGESTGGTAARLEQEKNRCTQRWTWRTRLRGRCTGSQRRR